MPIDTRTDLHAHLELAITIEVTTIPPYLYAMRRRCRRWRTSWPDAPARGRRRATSSHVPITTPGSGATRLAGCPGRRRPSSDQWWGAGPSAATDPGRMHLDPGAGKYDVPVRARLGGRLVGMSSGDYARQLIADAQVEHADDSSRTAFPSRSHAEGSDDG
jgi:hypothetical protein